MAGWSVHTPLRYSSQTGGEAVFHKRLERELTEAQYRIKELEERLCPCEQHDWVEIHKKFVITCPTVADGEYLRTYKCRRCGKTIKKYDWE